VGGVIGDGGNGYGITKAGAGTLILSGVASTYTGQTVINAGTLQVAKLAAGGVNSSLGATVATTPIVLGDGVHAATLDYTGTTGDTSDRQFVVTLGSAGTIKASNAGFVDLGLSGMVANNGGITFDVTLGAGAGKLTESGVISGAGTLTKLGTGTLALSGANTYTGVTTISAGILQIGAGAGTGKLDPTGGIVDNATLEIDRTGTITQSTDLGVISGSGVVNLIGAGTTIFDLTNTYAGATTITAGILQIGAGAGTGKLNPTGGIVDNATLVINRTGTVTQSTDLGVISGGGVVNLTGAGTTVFDLANTYTGLTDVQAGTLSLIGGSAIANAANVQVSGGTLNVATSETVHNVALNSGTISLGSNTLSAGGTYTQLAGATLSLNITSPTASGSVAATGNGAIAPTSIISLNVASGVYIAGGSNWNVITSGGNGGLNAPVVTDNSYVLGFTPTVSGNNILITANRVNAYNTLSTNNGNDNAVGAALESAGPGATGDMLTVLNTLDSMGSAQQITNALETMTPDVSSGALTASRAMAENSFKMVGNRLGGARNVSEGSGVSSGDMTNGVGVWIQGLGSNMKQDERKGVQGFSANTWGTTIGADKVIDDHFRAGLAGGYSWAGVNSKTPGSPSDDINSYQATIYGSYDSLNLNKARQGAKKSPEAVRNQEENSWYVDGMLGFTENDYDSRREIWLTPASGRVAKADHSGQQYSTNFEGGYTFTFKETKALEVTPFASIGYNYLRMNSYKEKGANALDLSVQGDGFHQLEQAIGTKLAYPIVAKKVGTFIPSAKAAWLYDYIGDRFETNASFAGGGSSFTTKGAKPAKNGMLFGAELAFLNKGNVTVTGNWDITLKDQFMSNTYYGTVRYDF
jgi:outer membrane autotransporter protein